jgi:hypothetical protein
MFGWGRRERPADPGEPTDFEGWVRRFRLSDADGQRLHRQHAGRFYFLFGGALFALAFGTTSAFVAFGPALALLAALLALLFRVLPASLLDYKKFTVEPNPLQPVA